MNIAYKGDYMSISLDPYDIKILDALEKNGALTNTQLSEIVNLSASQCSRRRIRLEQEAFITGYHARLNNEKIGLTLRSVVRVNLNSHSQQNEADFINLIHQHEEIKEAFSVSVNLLSNKLGSRKTFSIESKFSIKFSIT